MMRTDGQEVPGVRDRSVQSSRGWPPCRAAPEQAAHRVGVRAPARPEGLSRRRRADPPALPRSQEDQLAALGLVVNAVALWNTRYLSAAVDQLRAGASRSRTRTSPGSAFLGAHINFLGGYAITASAPAQRGFGRSAKSPTCPLPPVEPGLSVGHRVGGMALRLVQVNFKARDDSALGRFWAEALGWDVSSSGSGATNAAPVGFVWTDPDAAVCVDVIAVPDPETVKYRAHLDLATTSAAHQTELVARLQELGATPADVGQGDVPWTVLADPEGNVFCVLEPREIYRDTGP